jgi:hypothetical protein
MANMRTYAGSKFLKFEDVYDDGSITSTIEHVEVNKKYDKPVITLRTRSQALVEQNQHRLFVRHLRRRLGRLARQRNR